MLVPDSLTIQRIGLLVGIVGLVIAAATSFYTVVKQIGEMEARLERRVTQVYAELDRRFDVTESRLIMLEARAQTSAPSGVLGDKESAPSAPAQSGRTPTTKEKPTTELTFLFDFPEEGQSFVAGSVINLRGRHTLPKKAFVWILLEDGFGNYYLQNPPVLLSKETWAARNVHLGTGITEIHAVWVTKEGDQEFQRKVERREWSGFRPLPSGSEIVATREISGR